MTYKVAESRSDITRGSEVKSFLWGYDVVEDTTDGPVKINAAPMGQQEARELAATYEWVKHLDAWLVTEVEDEDVIEDIGEILGLVVEIDFEGDDAQVLRELDEMTVTALRFLPAGLRKLADLYEKEWQSKHAATV